MDMRKVDKLPKHPGLRCGQKIKLLLDFYDGTDVEENRLPVHRKGDVGRIDGFGIVCGQEVVAVEICHHSSGDFKVIPVLPADLVTVPEATPLTQPDDRPRSLEDLLTGGDDGKPVIILDIKKLE
jgi:hypothetical protein